jgi:hypothetical protein
MENTVADHSVEAIDVAITGVVAATVPMASTATTTAVAKDKPKAKVKKEVTAVEREVQNQKRLARRVA